MPYLRLTVKMFQFLRLSTKFLAVLRLSVNPIETLIVTHIISKFKKTTWAARASNVEVSRETWQEEERERPKY